LFIVGKIEILIAENQVIRLLGYFQVKVIRDKRRPQHKRIRLQERRGLNSL